MRRLLRGWRIRSHKAVTRARLDELLGRKRTDDWWRYGYHDGDGTGEPRTPVTEHTDPTYTAISAAYRDGYAAGQRSRLTREIVRVRVAIQDRAAFSEPLV